jgi:hypothetical protein
MLNHFSEVMAGPVPAIHVFDETDHTGGVIPGRHREVASPESIPPG